MIEIAGARVVGVGEILTPEALAFLADLQATFGPRREALLQARRDRQAAIDGGADLDFDPATADLRAKDWTVPPAPADLDDRRVEITGPAEPKMMINALNSGARVFREATARRERTEEAGRQPARLIREISRIPRRLGYHLGPE